MKGFGIFGIEPGDKVVNASEVKAPNKKLRELDRLLGRKTMDAELLRETPEAAQSERLILRMSLLPLDDTP
ncbi:hypothetical protein Q667_15765 [Marinobacter sp. C1S70]|nr:hypothetical protein Q667_15765 [Marinobacter sp. C1S70]